ncbi:dihydroxy-acid dehydratase domain-containing protein, partial [Enterobacter hormaechei]|uniref:dihydroxy-acid dehydratase domain-containing protein n=1 Tax=Enterobacter hormaechei TaxID=158836 RepID=UPI0013D69D18
ANYMEDFFAAGGVGAVMRELKDKLHLECLTVTGETLGDRLSTADDWVDRGVIAAQVEPLEPVGGLVALFG